MKADYQKYLQSAYWQQRRQIAIKNAGDTCEKCDIPRWLSQIAYQQDLNVHHLNYQNLGHEEDVDLEVLCRRCHDIETFGRSDFRAPKKATCEFCMEEHWDVYSPHCDVCLALFGVKEPISLRFDYTDPTNGHQTRIWESVLGELLWFFESEAGPPLHKVMSAITEKLKRIHDYKHKPAQDTGGLADEDIPF